LIDLVHEHGVGHWQKILEILHNDQHCFTHVEDYNKLREIYHNQVKKFSKVYKWPKKPTFGTKKDDDEKRAQIELHWVEEQTRLKEKWEEAQKKVKEVSDCEIKLKSDEKKQEKEIHDNLVAKGSERKERIQKRIDEAEEKAQEDKLAHMLHNRAMESLIEANERSARCEERLLGMLETFVTAYVNKQQK